VSSLRGDSRRTPSGIHQEDVGQRIQKNEPEEQDTDPFEHDAPWCWQRELVDKIGGLQSAILRLPMSSLKPIKALAWEKELASHRGENMQTHEPAGPGRPRLLKSPLDSGGGTGQPPVARMLRAIIVHCLARWPFGERIS
jgi:hypothetical protein